MNDVEEEKDVGKKVDTQVKTVEVFGHLTDGVEFQQEAHEHFEHKKGCECD